MNRQSGSIVSFLTILFLLIFRLRSLVFSAGLLLLLTLESQAANVFFSQYDRPVDGEARYIQLSRAGNGDIYILDIGSRRVLQVIESRDNDTPLVDPLVPSDDAPAQSPVHLIPATRSSFQTDRLRPLRQQLVALGVSASGNSVVTGLNAIFNRTYDVTHSNGSASESGIIAIESLTFWIQQLQHADISADNLADILNQLAGLNISVLVPELVAVSGLPPIATVHRITVNARGHIEFALQVTLLIEGVAREEPVTAELTLTKSTEQSRLQTPSIPRANIARQGLIIREPPAISNILEDSEADNIAGATAAENTPEATATVTASEDEEIVILFNVYEWLNAYSPNHNLTAEVNKYLQVPIADPGKNLKARERLRRRVLGFWDKHSGKPFAKGNNNISHLFQQLKDIERNSQIEADNKRRSDSARVSTSQPPNNRGSCHQGSQINRDATTTLTAATPVNSNADSNGGGVEVIFPHATLERITENWMRRRNHGHRNFQQQSNQRVREFQGLIVDLQNHAATGNQPASNHQAGGNNGPASNHRTVVNNPSGEQRYGCAHYRRNCDVRIEGCTGFYACPRCHNDECKDPNCRNKNAKSRDAQTIKCGKCGHEQDLSTGCEARQHCPGCDLELAKYFCEQCNHYDDVDREPFHCDQCGICRIRKSIRYHCDGCGVCLDIKHRGKHTCRDDTAHDVCPVCLEDTYKGCVILPCSHKLHKKCLEDLIKSEHTRCPVCKEPFMRRRPNNGGQQ